jgi:hypothetical protein
MIMHLTPTPGHVVAVTTLPTCDICGDEPASWDLRTRFGPWANACESCAPGVAAEPGVTGVGIGQRLVLASEALGSPLGPPPLTVGAVLAHKRKREERDDGLRFMLVPDRSDAFTRSGRSLVSDPIRIPEPVARATSREMAKLARVRDVVRARREREARVVREAATGIAELADWLGGEGAAS